MSFTVTLSKPSLVPVSLRLHTLNGSAHAASDYQAVVDRELVIPAGVTLFPVQINILGDSLVEGDQMFSLILSEPKWNGSIDPSRIALSDGLGIATITDDDQARMRIFDTKVTEGPSVNPNLVFDIRIDRAAEYPITVNLTTQNGTATWGNDYGTLSSLMITIPAGALSSSVTVPILSDNLVESDETSACSLTSLD